jgi:hypothetical protein
MKMETHKTIAQGSCTSTRAIKSRTPNKKTKHSTSPIVHPQDYSASSLSTGASAGKLTIGKSEMLFDENLKLLVLGGDFLAEFEKKIAAEPDRTTAKKMAADGNMLVDIIERIWIEQMRRQIFRKNDRIPLSPEILNARSSR